MKTSWNNIKSKHEFTVHFPISITNSFFFAIILDDYKVSLQQVPRNKTEQTEQGRE